MKNNTYWCIVSHDGYPVIDTVSYLRREAIDKYLTGMSYTWSQCRKYGWAVRKIKIVEA
jgi:hypothetical protein